MQCVTRPRITELNPHLLCVLCGGYYIDATAIIECLHSFCKSCIVRYLETRKYCPICDVLVHKTKPLQNLRPDTVLQNIVYKLVPNLYEKEMRNRRTYYSKVQACHHPQTTEENGIITDSSKFFSDSDSIDFSLEYVNYSECHFYVAANSRRYFRCQACVTIEQLRKLIEAKHTTTNGHQARFFFNEVQLPDHLTLLDVAYISAWKRQGFIRILYEIQVKRVFTESKLKPSPSTAVIEAISAAAPVPATLTPCTDSALIENAAKTVISTELSENVNIVPVTTKESSPVPAAIVTTTSASIPCPVSGENDIAVTSFSASTSPNTSTSSVTVTCSMNSDDITTSSVGTPITTSVCIVPVNGLSLSPKAATPISSPRATTKEEESTKEKGSKLEVRVDERPSNVVVEEVTPAQEKSEDISEKTRVPSPPVKRPLVEDESKAPPTPSTNSSETSPKPAKIPKFSGLVEKVSSANEAPKITVDVQETLPSNASSVTVSPIPAITSTVTCSVSGSTTSGKATVTVLSTSRVDCVQKSSPRPIFNRADVPTITKSTTKIMKNFTRPWNSSSTNPSVPDVVDANNQFRSTTKIIKARPTPPRYSANRSVYEPAALPASTSKSPMVKDAAKKSSASSKIFPVMQQIDPQTLGPIVATTAATSIAPISPSSSKKSFSPFLAPAAELYTSSGPFTSSGLCTYTSPNLTAKPPGSYVMPNPILPINQIMYEMYGGNGARTLEYMKAMTQNFCPPPSMFHPSLHPSMGPFYNSMQKKYEKKSRPTKGSALNQSPPSVQRIPPSNNNTKLAISEHSSGDKKHVSEKHESVSNGQLKPKAKKTDANSSSGSSFSINNLIPLDTEKNSSTTGVSHTCSADGIHQVCDQMPTLQKTEDKGTVETKKTAAESKLNNTRKE